MLILVYSNVYQSIPVPTLADSPTTAVFNIGVQYDRKCIFWVKDFFGQKTVLGTFL